jgi:hypothetical protein
MEDEKLNLELAESLVDLLRWMRKWTSNKRAVIPQIQVK